MREAGLEKECVITGNLTKVEIWAKAEWETYSQESSEEFEKAAENIEEYGLY